MVKNSSEDQILLATGTRRSQEKVTAYGRLLSVLRAWPKRLTLANVHELKQANAKHGATVDPPKDKPSFTLAKPSTPGTRDNDVELPSC